MEVHNSDTELSSVSTPSNSQEVKLLHETGEHSSVSATGGEGGTKSKPFALAPAKLLAKPPIQPGVVSKNSRGELTMAIKVSAPGSSTNAYDQVQPKASRYRKQSNRPAARNASNQNANQNADQNETDLQSDASKKRSRAAGETPPSAQQQKKKNRRSRKKGGGQFPNVGQNDQSTVVHRNETPTSVPPGSAKTQLSGPVAGGSSNEQPTVGSGDRKLHEVPPVSKAQLIGPKRNPDPAHQPKQSNTETINVEESDQEEDDTYASVTSSDLCVAVIDLRGSEEMTLMDQQKFDKLSSAITDTILSQAGKQITPPEFDDTRLRSGAMRVRCANILTRQWLEKFVPLLDKNKLWKGASLVVTGFKDIPKPHKFNVSIKGINKGARDIFRLLESQNKGITTKSWTALKCEYKNGTTHMVIGVGQDSFDVLTKRANTLFCGMNKASFSVVKRCKENRIALQRSVGSGQTRVNANSGAPSTSTEPENMVVDDEGPSSAQ